MTKYLSIALGGSLGSLTRYLVGALVTARFSGTGFWIGTFVVNMTACVIIGFSLAFLEKHSSINIQWRYFVPIGFVGAYSTFSTFEWELFGGLRAGAFTLCALYLVLSITVGLAAVWAGTRLAGGL